jgi:hypothetical protein
MENLHDDASTQYHDWTGTFAGDERDSGNLGVLLGIDTKAWFVILVDLYFNGGDQTIVAYGVERQGDRNLFDILAHQISTTGVIEVTRLVDTQERPHGHFDTNPPRPPAVPISWGTELIAFGFKRAHLRFQWRPHALSTTDYRIEQIATIVPDS